MNYKVTKDARKQLREIARFTARRWDKEQAHRYIREIEATFLLIAARPERGRGDKRGVRRTRIVSHLIYYRVVDDAVWILAVLHKSQLPERHLRDK